MQTNIQFNKGLRYQLMIGFAILISLSSFYAQAGLFGEKQEVKTIKPEAALSLDGALVLDFAWRSDLGFDATKLNIIASYGATKPDAKGVKTVSRKDCGSGSNGEIAMPVPRNCQKWQQPVIYTLIPKPEWISFSASNKINLQLPERIKGAGDYQLSGVRFDCPQSLCKGKKFTHTSLYDSDFMLNFTARAKDDKQHTLLLANDISGSFTAQYTGVLLGLVHSRGFYGEENHADLSNYNGTENGGFYSSLQDKDGKWHVSETAFKTRYEGSCQSNYNGPSINAKQYSSMKWAQAFPAATYGSVYDAYVYDKNDKQVQITPAQWTGCVSFKAQNPDDDYEERQYSFENGKLYKRRIIRYVKGVSLDETIYLDSQGKLSAYRRLEYVDKSKKETKLVWSQLEQEAYPQTKPAPNVDLKALQLEAADVLKIIAPEFAKKP
jgi:hypothetical protein